MKIVSAAAQLKQEQDFFPKEKILFFSQADIRRLRSNREGLLPLFFPSQQVLLVCHPVRAHQAYQNIRGLPACTGHT